MPVTLIRQKLFFVSLERTKTKTIKTFDWQFSGNKNQVIEDILIYKRKNSNAQRKNTPKKLNLASWRIIRWMYGCIRRGR